ncbi:hypothetical protein FGO68_gene8928 [Halteria grandinella]|uniref:Uncharacterized protein n=1 Tax=Halteria grandinella TaxID=5974 RepID=A0A8J8SW29_HALGN|nr:hypothetical protein FGO68_gene8928 [Halteria grandinella]
MGLQGRLEIGWFLKERYPLTGVFPQAYSSYLILFHCVLSLPPQEPPVLIDPCLPHLVLLYLPALPIHYLIQQHRLVLEPAYLPLQIGHLIIPKQCPRCVLCLLLKPGQLLLVLVHVRLVGFQEVTVVRGDYKLVVIVEFANVFVQFISGFMQGLRIVEEASDEGRLLGLQGLLGRE